MPISGAAWLSSAFIRSAWHTPPVCASIFDSHLLKLFKRSLDFLELQTDLMRSQVQPQSACSVRMLDLGDIKTASISWSLVALSSQSSRVLAVLLRCTSRGGFRNCPSCRSRPVSQPQSPRLRSSTARYRVVDRRVKHRWSNRRTSFATSTSR